MNIFIKYFIFFFFIFLASCSKSNQVDKEFDSLQDFSFAKKQQLNHSTNKKNIKKDFSKFNQILTPKQIIKSVKFGKLDPFSRIGTQNSSVSPG